MPSSTSSPIPEHNVLASLEPLDEHYDSIVDQLASTGQTVKEATSGPEAQEPFNAFTNKAKYGVSDPKLLTMPEFVRGAEKKYEKTRQRQFEDGSSITEHSSWNGIYSTIPEGEEVEMNPLQAFLMGNRPRPTEPAEPTMSELGFQDGSSSSESSDGSDDEDSHGGFGSGAKDPAAYRKPVQSVEQDMETDEHFAASPEPEVPTAKNEDAPFSSSRKRKASVSEELSSDSEYEKSAPAKKKVKDESTPKRMYNRLRDAPGKDVVDCGFDITTEEALTFLPNSATQTYAGWLKILQQKPWPVNEIVEKIAWPRGLNEPGEFSIRPTISKRTTKVLQDVMGFKIDTPHFRRDYLDQGNVPVDNTAVPSAVEDPMLKDLAKGLRGDRLPTGAAAGL